MDNCRFDNLTRMVAVQADRRTAVKAFAGGIAALATLARVELGLAQGGDVGIESHCELNGARCRRDGQCCSLKCKKRSGSNRGRCKCASRGAGCKAAAGCCTGYCASGTCSCIPNNNNAPCGTNSDCCSSNCEETTSTCKCVPHLEPCRTSSQCCSGRTCKTVQGHSGTVCG